MLRSAIGFAPLLIASITYKNDHSSLLASTRFFLSFSLAAAAGSLGLGAYVYSLNISPSNTNGVGQVAGIVAYIFRQINSRWWIFSAILVMIILWSMGSLIFTPYHVFFLAASLFVAPTLLVSTQCLISSGSKRLFLIHSFLQCILLVSFLPFASSRQHPSWIYLIALALVFMGIHKYVSRSCIDDCLQKSVVDNILPINQSSAFGKESIDRLRAQPTIALSIRLKCFADAFFPLAYTSSILVFFERLHTSSSQTDQILFYNYSRISDAIVSLFVTFCTLSVSKKLFKLLDAGSGPSRKKTASVSARIGDACLVILPIFAAFLLCISIGYAFNYLLLGSFSIVLASFDVLISSLKLAGIFLSLYMLTRLPSLALASQAISLTVVLLGASLADNVTSFLFIVVVALAFASLFPLAVFLARARLLHLTKVIADG